MSNLNYCTSARLGVWPRCGIACASAGCARLPRKERRTWKRGWPGLTTRNSLVLLAVGHTAEALRGLTVRLARLIDALLLRVHEDLSVAPWRTVELGYDTERPNLTAMERPRSLGSRVVRRQRHQCFKLSCGPLGGSWLFFDFLSLGHATRSRGTTDGGDHHPPEQREAECPA